MILIFDTETTGLPKDKFEPINPTNWPHIVQLAWLIYDLKGELIKKQNLYIRPDHFNIPQTSIEIHGITEEFAFQNGITLAETIYEFTNDLILSNIIVGHNLNFDISMLQVEWMRTQMPHNIYFLGKKNLCTGLLSKDYLNIPNKDNTSNKFPSLKELYYKLFGKDFENAHNALIDTEITAKCFWELVKRQVIKI